MDKSDQEKNNNVILLIVIAIATMIIVVVGATFAYLSDVVENEAAANIGGKTEGGSDMLVLDAGDVLSLNVTYDNFGINTGDQSDSTIASVTLAAGRENIKHKYNMYLEVESNNFEYTTGKCYLKNNIIQKTEAENRSECVNQGNIWARSAQEKEYSCYDKNGATAIEMAGINDELACDFYGNTIWEKVAVPELVLDLYTKTDETSQNACLGDDESFNGVCVMPNATIEHVSKENCTEGTWISNIFKANNCYSLSEVIDITENDFEEKPKYEIIKEKEIVSTRENDVSDYYLAAIRMINLGHNQLTNTSKLFSGNLVLEVVDENIQTAR